MRLASVSRMANAGAMASEAPPTPLIVCGFGRSGTRMCSNILANCAGVEMQGEMAEAVATLAYLKRMKAHFEAGSEAQRASWARKDYAFYRDVLRGASHASPIVRRNARYFGHKTPHHERYFADYEALFDRLGEPARYVYCLRHPHDVWRSLRMMPWSGHRDARAFARSWRRSVERFEAMRRAAPGRVLAFNLDAMLRAPDPQAWAEEALLQPLGLSPADFLKPFETLGNTNSAQVKYGRAPDPLPPADIARLDADLGDLIAVHFPWRPARTFPSLLGRLVVKRP